MILRLSIASPITARKEAKSHLGSKMPSPLGVASHALHSLFVWLVRTRSCQLFVVDLHARFIKVKVIPSY